MNKKYNCIILFVFSLSNFFVLESSSSAKRKIVEVSGNEDPESRRQVKRSTFSGGDENVGEGRCVTPPPKKSGSGGSNCLTPVKAVTQAVCSGTNYSSSPWRKSCRDRFNNREGLEKVEAKQMLAGLVVASWGDCGPQTPVSRERIRKAFTDVATDNRGGSPHSPAELFASCSKHIGDDGAGSWNPIDSKHISIPSPSGKKQTIKGGHLLRNYKGLSGPVIYSPDDSIAFIRVKISGGRWKNGTGSRKSAWPTQGCEDVLKILDHSDMIGKYNNGTLTVKKHRYSRMCLMFNLQRGKTAPPIIKTAFPVLILPYPKEDNQLYDISKEKKLVNGKGTLLTTHRILCKDLKRYIQASLGHSKRLILDNKGAAIAVDITLQVAKDYFGLKGGEKSIANYFIETGVGGVFKDAEAAASVAS